MERIKLTKREVLSLALPDAGKRKTVYDTEIPKLALRVTAAGAKTFYVVKRSGSTMAWIKLGQFPDITVEQARNEATKVLGEFATGSNPAEVRRAVKREMTFSEAFGDYLVNKKKRDGTPLTPKTKTNYSDVVRIYLGSIAVKKLSQITRDEIKAIHAKASRTSNAQADRAVRIVSAVFNFAIDLGFFADRNPAQQIQKNASIERDRFVGAGELPHLFDAIDKSINADFFFVSLLTGARRSNVQAMAWHDVDLVGGVWRIGKTKNGTPQNVTLSPEAVTILEIRKQRANGASFAFPSSKSKTGHLVEPKTAWATILRRATTSRLVQLLYEMNHLNEEESREALKLISDAPSKAEKHYKSLAIKLNIAEAAYDMTDLQIHDLRRTLGSWQAKTGSSLPIIGKSLNHKSTQATRIYARLDLDPVRNSVNTATKAMFIAAEARQNRE
ncbi:tyrosine-type recombinase/integrase [Pseudomonas sp. LB3P25]